MVFLILIVSIWPQLTNAKENKAGSYSTGNEQPEGRSKELNRLKERPRSNKNLNLNLKKRVLKCVTNLLIVHNTGREALNGSELLCGVSFLGSFGFHRADGLEFRGKRLRQICVGVEEARQRLQALAAL